MSAKLLLFGRYAKPGGDLKRFKKKGGSRPPFSREPVPTLFLSQVRNRLKKKYFMP